MFSVYFERKVYPFLDRSAVYLDLSILFVVEHVFSNVIYSFQVVRGCKLGKIVKNLEHGQKGNSFYDDVMQVLSLVPPFFFPLYFISPRSC